MNTQLASYLYNGAVLTGSQMIAVLAEPLLLAFALHFIAALLQNRGMHLLGDKNFMFLTAPGTVLHELSHAVFCILFGHRVLSITLFKPGVDGIVGSVEHSYNPRNPWHQIGNFFIGIGPVIGGSAALLWILQQCGIHEFTWDVAKALPYREWWFYLLLYGAFCAGSHVTLSPADLRASLGGFIAITLFWLLANWGTQWKGNYTQIMVQWILQTSQNTSHALLIALSINAIVLMLFSLLGLFRR